MGGSRANLITLADREFRQVTGSKAKPEPARKFKPIRLNLARFDNTWDKKRGAAVRLMGVLLREDDSTFERRVCENDKSARTYAEAADWMQRESAYLRRIARLLETAGGRVASVVARCREEPQLR